MIDPHTIAKGLTKAQQEALLTGQWVTPHIGKEQFYVVRFTGDVWPQGVANYLSTQADTLTPLGLAVRAELESHIASLQALADEARTALKENPHADA